MEELKEIKLTDDQLKIIEKSLGYYYKKNEKLLSNYIISNDRDLYELFSTELDKIDELNAYISSNINRCNAF